ncbi:MAG: hypothetical protein RL481_876 [Pseudomonadota bacterium]
MATALCRYPVFGVPLILLGGGSVYAWQDAPGDPSRAATVVVPTVDLQSAAPVVEGATLVFRAKSSTVLRTNVRIFYTVEDPSGVLRAGFSNDVLIPAGEAQADIRLATIDDQIVNGTRGVTIRLSEISGRARGGNAQANGSVRDNDRPPEPLIASISARSPSVVEGQTATFLVNLSAPAPQSVSIAYRIDAGDALSQLSRNDRLIISQGQRSARIAVRTADDSIVNGSRPIVATLTDIDGGRLGRTSARMAVTDNDKTVPPPPVDPPAPTPPPPPAPTYAIRSNGDVAEGGTLHFTVSSDRALRTTRRVFVAVSAPDGALIEPIGSFVTFRPGATSAQLSLTSSDDAIKSDARTVSVSLRPADAMFIDRRFPRATAMISDNDPETVIEQEPPEQPPVIDPPIPPKTDGRADAPIEPPGPADANGLLDRVTAMLPDVLWPILILLGGLIAAWFAATRAILPRFYKVGWEIGLPHVINAENSGGLAMPDGSFVIKLGDPVSVDIGECEILAMEERNDADDSA